MWLLNVILEVENKISKLMGNISNKRDKMNLMRILKYAETSLEKKQRNGVCFSLQSKYLVRGSSLLVVFNILKMVNLFYLQRINYFQLKRQQRGNFT